MGNMNKMVIQLDFDMPVSVYEGVITLHRQHSVYLNLYSASEVCTVDLILLYFQLVRKYRFPHKNLTLILVLTNVQCN